MGCAASTNGAPAPAVAAFDAGRPYHLDPQVAIRPEPFGALAYHYGNRRLTFVRATELVSLLRELGSYDSVDDALAASSIAPGRWPAFREALASLARSEVIRAR
ncbi:MAG: mycofactocin biosynthesis chaperone MftB [Acidimicrobiales bacterium]